MQVSQGRAKSNGNVPTQVMASALSSALASVVTSVPAPALADSECKINKLNFK